MLLASRMLSPAHDGCALQAVAKPLQNDESRKAEQRKVVRAVKLHVNRINQISATEEQVSLRS